MNIINKNIQGTLYEVNGVPYAVFYRRDLSKLEYTKEKVFHIYTGEQSFPEAHKCINTIMASLGLSTITKGMYITLNEREPSLLNHLKHHHTIDFDDDLDCFVYTIIEPYDD
jgi:hypothetical protein